MSHKPRPPLLILLWIALGLGIASVSHPVELCSVVDGGVPAGGDRVLACTAAGSAGRLFTVTTIRDHAPQSHEASHRDGGADELLASLLATACTDGQVHGALAGAVTCQTLAAADVGITDAGGLYVATTVEAALAESPPGARAPTAHASTHGNGAADEVAAESLGTACADGEILKAQTGGLICGSAGAASFTTIDADYGPEAVASAWEFGGTLRVPIVSALVAADCDAAGEAGRVVVLDTAATGQQWYACEGVAGWVQQGGSATAGEYHPDTPPASPATGTDEFDGGFGVTWTWGNQTAGATDTAELDTASYVVPHDAANSGEIVLRCTTGPTPSSDWTVAAKMQARDAPGDADSVMVGIGIVTAGTLATPTGIDVLWYRQLATNSWSINARQASSYTTITGQVGSSLNWGTQSLNPNSWPPPVYLRMTYDSAALSLCYYYSWDGYDWQQIGCRTLGAHPTGQVCRSAYTNNASETASGRYDFFRAFASVTAEIGD